MVQEPLPEYSPEGLEIGILKSGGKNFLKVCEIPFYGESLLTEAIAHAVVGRAKKPQTVYGLAKF